MKVIALAGGTGTGKSTIAAYLEAKGAAILDADKIGHDLLNGDEAVRAKVLDGFGKSILNSAGEIDRFKLGELVFKDEKSLCLLNSILHPAIIERTSLLLDELRLKETPLAVIDAALILDVETPFPLDCTIALRCGREEQARRIRDEKGLNEKTIALRLESQRGIEKSFHKADVILDTAKGRDEVFKEVDVIVANLIGGPL